MTREEVQMLLIAIVETWRPNEYPEYRGFRCANCQQYKNEAWYHWVNNLNYRLPVHMCSEICEKKFQSQTLKIDTSKRQKVDRKIFGNSYKFNDEAKKRFTEIINAWTEYEQPKLKVFSCDACGKDLNIDSIDGRRKGYHVWWKMNDGKTLAELHFHKVCGNQLGLSIKEENNLFS